MKKFLLVISCIILMFALCACDLGYGVNVGEGGITKGSNAGFKPVASNNAQTSVGGNGGNNQTSIGGGNGGNTQTSVGGNNGGNTQTSTGGNGGGNTQTSTGGNTQTSTGGNTQTSTGGNGGGQPSGEVSSSIKPISQGGLSESAFVTWADSNIASAAAYYKLSSASSWTQADKELIRTVDGNARVDFLGLKAGTYDLRVHVGGENADIEIKNVVVNAYDRSGYAHDGFSGVGAYNDDGTLKSGVSVVYVSESTKANLVSSIQKGNVCVRILGKISCPQYLSKNKLDSSITDIKGITRSNLGDDSYWNMIDVSGKSNVTVEGVGTDAEFFQFGLTFKKCNSIEVRNLTFSDYPEDACSFEGSKGSEGSYKNYWVHNCQFNVGKNGWDLTSEQDKHYGDGATDIKHCSNVTMSYNLYNGCQKTMLVGGADTHVQYNVTLHHNYYKSNKSRLPLARVGNVHIYNCYYESNTTCMSARANAFIFLEANYFKSNSTLTDSNTKFKIKAYNNTFDGTKKTSYISEVTSRDASVSTSNKYDTKFAYKKAISYCSDAQTAMNDCKKYSGVGKGNK